MPVGLIFVLFVGTALGIRLLAGYFDRGRVSLYLAANGSRMNSMRWTPFGTGWFGSKNERIYEIEFRDEEGRNHRATCKTSMLSGVYLTEDVVIGESREQAARQDLAEENSRLREELARLKGR